MRIIADTHIHVYSCYDAQAGIENLSKNMAKYDGDALRVACLAERHDCQFFSALTDGEITFDGFRIGPAGEPGCLVISKEGEAPLYLFAGRQIVTKERLEVLALTVNINVPDGLPVKEVLEQVLESGGIPVVSWAPGKWFFERGRVVEEMIESFSPGQILFGDTTMRPTVWMEPGLMRLALKKGFSVVAGSDPLPFAGEEKQMGLYASIIEGEFDTELPVSSFRKLLKEPSTPMRRVGKRSSLFDVLTRFKKNAASKN